MQGGAFVGLANYNQMFSEPEVLGGDAQQHALADRGAGCCRPPSAFWRRS
jgi:hypothetical protein